jgi:aromatic-L-amino-acid decarboxylase
MTRPLTLGPDRDAALEHAAALVARAWREFDQAREVEALPTSSLLTVLNEPLPQEPNDVIASLDTAAEVLDTSLSQARPRYLAYIGSSGLEVGALADLLAHSYDINLALDARAASHLDRQALAWLAEFLGYPAGGGSFTSGGTISNITALAVARERAIPGSRAAGLSGQRVRVYCSREAHYSVTRAAELLGIGRDNVYGVDIDELRRMDAADLSRQIDEDLAGGITPIAVIATGGTTLTGAVDPLDAIADVCEPRGVWLHVDGAYGLPAAASRTSGFRFAGLDRVDSLTIDAHKWLFVPKACSAILVRRTADLAATFAHDEAYIPHEQETLNAVDITLEYSRPLRALKMWLAFRVHGAEAFREAIDRNIQQAHLLYALAGADPEFETRAHPPQLSIVPIRHVRPECPDRDDHNAALCRAIQDDGRVYLSPAVIDGQIWLRPCFTNFRTTEEDVRITLEVAAELGRGLCPMH